MPKPDTTVHIRVFNGQSTEVCLIFHLIMLTLIIFGLFVILRVDFD